MLTGLLEPTRGHIFYNGCDIREDPVAFKSRIGYVPEEPYLYPYLTGREYLQLVGRLRGLPEKTVTDRADSLLRLFGLGASRYSTISGYSKGMRQKVLISAALLPDPEILIFDEPLSGLDVTSALVFRNLVQMLVRSAKIVLYSSHMLDVVEKVCTRVVILRRGQVVANDSVERLRDLMALPSLEDVFSQLAVQEDTDQIAREMLTAMQA
jgi:ABC-2 type transport system ATP-binding protein